MANASVLLSVDVDNELDNVNVNTATTMDSPVKAAVLLEYELLNVAAIDVTPLTVDDDTSYITDDTLCNVKWVVELTDADHTPSGYSSLSAMVFAYTDTWNVDPGSNLYCGTTSHIFAAVGRVNAATGTTTICAASDCALVPVMVATTVGTVALPSKNALFNVPVQSTPLAVLTDPQLMVCDVTPDRDTTNVTVLELKLPNVVPSVHTLALTYGLSWNTVGVLSTKDTCVRAALGVLRFV
jgi:hypothetical protein